MLDLRSEATFAEGAQEEVKPVESQKVEAEQKTATKKVVTELTEGQIAAWKKEWGKVFKTVVDGEAYVWRKLRRHEYVQAMSLEVEEGELAKNNIYYRQEYIANTITLHPANVQERLTESAGLATAIADAAIAVAGFDVEETKEL